MHAEHADGPGPGMVRPVECSKIVAREATPMRWPVSIRVFRVHLPVSALKPCLLCHPPHPVARLPRSHRHTTTHAPVPGAPTTPSRRAARCQNLTPLFDGHTPAHAECCRDGATPCTVRHVASAVAPSMPRGTTGKQNPARHRLPRRNRARAGRSSGTRRVSPNRPTSPTPRDETPVRQSRPSNAGPAVTDRRTNAVPKSSHARRPRLTHSETRRP